MAEITDRLARAVDARYVLVWTPEPVEALDDRTPTAMIVPRWVSLSGFTIP